MKIKTQLWSASVLAISVALVASLSIWWAVRASAVAEQEQRRAQALSREVAGLLVLTQEYAARGEPRAAQQWWARHTHLSAELSSRQAGPEAAELQGMRDTAEGLGAAFSRLSEVAREPSSALGERRRELLVDQLLTDAQMLADGAYRWSRDAAQVQSRAQRRVEWVGLVAFASVVLLLLAQALAVGRSMLGPLAAIRHATQRLGEGDLSARIASDARNELGSLARSFDGMAQALDERTRQLARSEAQVRDILEHAPDAFISMDAQGCITEWNHQAEATFGWRRDEVLGRTLSQVVIPPSQRQAHETGMRGFARHGGGPVINQRIEVTALHRDGHEIPVELSVSALREGEAFVANAFLHDISQRKASEAHIAAGRKRLADVTDNIPAMVGYFDAQERCEFANAPAYRILKMEQGTRYTLREALGEANYRQHKPYVDLALSGQRAAFEGLSVDTGPFRHFQAHVVPDVGADGVARGFYLMGFDITALKEAEQALAQLARVDSLTGLPNRRQFEEIFQQAQARARRQERGLALMFLDIDHFKSINDSHGHAAGDTVLRGFADRLQGCVRATDTVARLAGDEFVILLEGLREPVEASLVADKIAESLAEPMRVGDKRVAVTTSIGIALCEAGQSRLEDVIAAADQALYQAKRAGRARFAMADRPQPALRA